VNKIIHWAADILALSILVGTAMAQLPVHISQPLAVMRQHGVDCVHCEVMMITRPLLIDMGQLDASDGISTISSLSTFAMKETLTKFEVVLSSVTHL